MKADRAGEIVVLVDNEASKENVARAAGSKGWAVADIREDGGDWRITIRKG
jgi:TusA-related sulfurtransferase